MSRRPRRPGLLGIAIGLAICLEPALAPATIEEQRQRLPPPAFECGDDPITGVWQAHTYYAHVDQWYMFRLDISRDPDDPSGARLRGTIDVEFWDGGSDLSQPPDCKDQLADRRGVFEHAGGEAHGLELRFDAQDWRYTDICGPTRGGYLLDRFSGTVDPELMEFQSLLNADAPEWQDVPTVFRRVRCGAASRVDDEPKITIAPPPFQPPEQREGCGLRSDR